MVGRGVAFVFAVFVVVVLVFVAVDRVRVLFGAFDDAFASGCTSSAIATSASTALLVRVFGFAAWEALSSTSVSCFPLRVLLFETASALGAVSVASGTTFFGLPRVFGGSATKADAGTSISSAGVRSGSIAFVVRVSTIEVFAGAFVFAATLAEAVVIFVVLISNSEPSVAFARARVTRFGGESGISAGFLRFLELDWAWDTMGSCVEVYGY